MLLAFAFLWLAHGETTPHVLQARPELNQACAVYLATTHFQHQTGNVLGYLQTSRNHLKNLWDDDATFESRAITVTTTKKAWEPLIAQRLLNLGYIDRIKAGPWKLDRAKIIERLPSFAPYFPKNFSVWYDPFDLLVSGASARVSHRPNQIFVPWQLLDEEHLIEAEYYLIHEILHIRMSGHPLSRHYMIEEDVPHPPNLPRPYRRQLSTEEFFTFTNDLSNLMLIERSGTPFPRTAEDKEKTLRAVLAQYLETIHPFVRDDAWAGSFTEAVDTYTFRQSPLSVFLEPRDVKRTLRRDLKAEAERMADICRDLLARLDAPGDRLPALREFLRKYDVAPVELRTHLP